MIVGIGVDIVEIRRIRDMLEKHDSAFLNKIFTENEHIEADGRSDISVYFAGRWAAKEAFSKALGTGFGKFCSWTDISISNNDSGKPEILISGNAAEFAEKLKIVNIHLSISHEKEYACASVILEK
jgi:holo-[acyl-carrier protein] synthase